MDPLHVITAGRATDLGVITRDPDAQRMPKSAKAELRGARSADQLGGNTLCSLSGLALWLASDTRLPE